MGGGRCGGEESGCHKRRGSGVRGVKMEASGIKLESQEQEGVK